MNVVNTSSSSPVGPRARNHWMSHAARPLTSVQIERDGLAVGRHEERARCPRQLRAWVAKAQRRRQVTEGQSAKLILLGGNPIDRGRPGGGDSLDGFELTTSQQSPPRLSRTRLSDAQFGQVSVIGWHFVQDLWIPGSGRAEISENGVWETRTWISPGRGPSA